MKVWIVVDVWDGDGPVRVEKVFSSPEKASEYAEGFGLLRIDEWEVDEWKPEEDRGNEKISLGR